MSNFGGGKALDNFGKVLSNFEEEKLWVILDGVKFGVILEKGKVLGNFGAGKAIIE